MTDPTVPVRIAWPVDLRDAIRAELVGKLPLDVMALIEQARAEAYATGQLDGMRRVAANYAELGILGDGWQRQAQDTAAARRTALRAELEAHAERVRAARNLADGRPIGYQYRGGPVDFETGLPVGSACAWLRSKQRRKVEQPATVAGPRGPQAAAIAPRREAA